MMQTSFGKSVAHIKMLLICLINLAIKFLDVEFIDKLADFILEYKTYLP